jgi:cellulose biosynthesis protein BcsQ
MEGLGQFLHTAELIRKGLNRELKQLGILLTMYDSRNNLARQVMTEVRNHFGEAVFESVIPRNVKLSESPSHGKPAVLYDINSSGSQSYLSLAQEVLQRLEFPDSVVQDEGVFDGLTQPVAPAPVADVAGIRGEEGIENGLS